MHVFAQLQMHFYTQQDTSSLEEGQHYISIIFSTFLLFSLPIIWISADLKSILNPGSHKQAISCMCADSCLTHCENVNNPRPSILRSLTHGDKRQTDSKKMHIQSV